MEMITNGESVDMHLNQPNNYSPLSLNYEYSTRISPGSARRVGTFIQPNENNNPAVRDNVVRFDDEDGGGESTDSGDDRDELPSGEEKWSEAAESGDDSDLDNPRFMLRRRR